MGIIYNVTNDCIYKLCIYLVNVNVKNISLAISYTQRKIEHMIYQRIIANLFCKFYTVNLNH